MYDMTLQDVAVLPKMWMEEKSHSLTFDGPADRIPLANATQIRFFVLTIINSRRTSFLVTSRCTHRPSRLAADSSCSTLLGILNQAHTIPTCPPVLRHPSAAHSGVISAISSTEAALYAASTRLPPIKASPPLSLSYIHLSYNSLTSAATTSARTMPFVVFFSAKLPSSKQLRTWSLPVVLAS